MATYDFPVRIIEHVCAYFLTGSVAAYAEHLDELLLHYSNPIQQARYFGVIFNDVPTYEDIVRGTPDCTKITGVNKIFKSKKSSSELMAGEEGHIPTI